jgi:type I pantothenate kinase
VARYQDFDREQWAESRPSTAPATTFSGAARDPLPGAVPTTELVAVYVPLADLIRTRAAEGTPFVVAITGSVAVGKSAAATALATVLAPGPPALGVDVVGTDGFLLPNRVLAARGLADRKGFPETYDHESLVRFVAAVRAGEPEVAAPVYSHATYDIVEGAVQVVRRPAVLILEGLPFPDDHVQLSIFLDADESDIESWFVARFLALCEEARSDDASFFRYFSGYSQSDAVAFARQVWDAVNRVNLHEHILPTRERCDVILEKGPDHAVRRVRLRRS